MIEKTRIQIPLLDGEFNPSWKVHSRSQVLFLDIVSRTTPAPLYALRDEILPKFRKAFKAEKTKGRTAVEVSKLVIEAVADLLCIKAYVGVEIPDEVEGAMKVHRLNYDAGAALIAWSERFNLRGRDCAQKSVESETPEPTLQHRCWPVVAGLNAILFWEFHRLGPIWKFRNPPGWCPPVFTLQEPLPEPELLPSVQLRVSALDPKSNATVQVDAPGWYMEVETELQFRKRMSESFRQWLDGYIANRIHARAARLKETPGKKKLLLHFTWAAKYQIDEISPSRLAAAYRVKTDTVEAGVHGALELINLERRPPKRGGVKVAR